MNTQNLKIFFSAVIIILNVLIANSKTQPIEHIFIIDKSGSMQGKGDGHGINIWNDVTTTINNYVQNNLKPGDKFSFYTFDVITSDPKHYNFDGPSTKKTIVQKLNEIEANGTNTGIYDALYTACNAIDNNDGFIHKILLFTDGIDNCSKKNMEEIAQIFKLKKGDYDFIFYISIGQTIPAEVAFYDGKILKATENARGTEIIIPQKKKTLKGFSVSN